MGPRLLILVPLFVSIYILARHSVEKAFLSIYLPILLCFPLYDSLKLPNLPYLTFSETAILPIGIWLLATQWRRWRISRMDFWMLLFGISSCVSLYSVGGPSVGTFGLFSWLVDAFFPYAIGKLLIEQSELRVKTMQRIVLLLALLTISMLYEYRMGTNPLHLSWAQIIPPEVHAGQVDLTGFEQHRWGFTRAAGPTLSSETTGMVFMVGLLVGYVLYKTDQWEGRFRWSFIPFKKGTVLFAAVSVGMFITQARGPYLGVALGFLITRIFSARNTKRTAIRTLLFLAFVALPTYKAISSYSSASETNVEGDKANAVYRTIMIQNYIPVAEAGGLFGWGSFPVVDGQTSIDNAFLLYFLNQGYMGVISFMMLIVESLVVIFLSLKYLDDKKDKGIAFCLGGSIAGLALCLGTVWLSSPVLELLFLLLGWSQSVRGTVAAEEQQMVIRHPGKFAFRKVFT